MMKKLVKNTILIIIILSSIIFFNDIKRIIVDTIDKITYEKESKKLFIPKANEYKLTYNYNYIKETNDFVPTNQEHIKSIIYTILNRGWNKFTFICPKEYKSCSKDALEIVNNNLILSDINSFVHPYNSFKKISTSYNSNGRFTIEIEKNYDDKMIAQVNQKVDQINSAILTSNMSDETKIKTIHDYIINNSHYDENYSKGIKYFSSNTAYGTLIQGEAICSGYTDAMAIFLNRLSIPNYKISSDRHIWNLVYINNSWKHLDLTFDDPVTDSGEEILSHDFYLIDTDKLYSLDIEEHTFNKGVFREAN